jgi:hypothetical protein
MIGRRTKGNSAIATSVVGAIAETHNPSTDLRKDVRRQFQAHRAFAPVNDPFADDIPRCVITSEPDGGNNHQELDTGRFGKTAGGAAQMDPSEHPTD